MLTFHCRFCRLTTTSAAAPAPAPAKAPAAVLIQWVFSGMKCIMWWGMGGGGGGVLDYTGSANQLSMPLQHGVHTKIWANFMLSIVAY